MLTLDGRALTLEGIALAAEGEPAQLDPRALERVRSAALAAARAAESGTVYGRTTGVGANRDQPASTVEGREPGRELLRSHAGGWGPALSTGVVRAGLAVRANQLLSGQSGASPELTVALGELLAGDDSGLPVVHEHGGIGTSDLTALAEVGLTLLGERPRSGGERIATSAIGDDDALPLMSSGAFTLARAGLGCLELQRLSRTAMTVFALSHTALRGNRDAVGPAVQRVTPFAGAVETARVVEALVRPIDQTPAQVQDFYGLRAFPQVHGPLIERLADLRQVVESLANTGSENPAVLSADPPTVAHHGGFHTAYLALALDAMLLALVASAQSGLSRMSHLLTDPGSGLPRFLAGDQAGASGLLIVEYAAGSAVAVLRELASAPRSVLTTSVSAGVEDDASHSSQAAARLPEAVGCYRQLLALELLTAVRALRMGGPSLSGALADVMGRCTGIPADLADHDLAPDIAAAAALLDDPVLSAVAP